MPPDLAQYLKAESQLVATWRGKPVIAIADAYAPGLPLLAELATAGASVRGVVCRTAAQDTECASVPVWAADRHGFNLERWEFPLWPNHCPPALLRWLAEVDPSGRAAAIGDSQTAVPDLAGRRIYGYRRTEWVRFEDKTLVDEVFADLEVRAPRAVVIDPATEDPEALFADLASSKGVVVSLDTSSGVHGGASGVKSAMTASSLARALSWASTCSHRVRVAEFVCGLPCSAIGVCLPAGVFTFDPFELIVLQRPGEGSFTFCGWSSWWRAPKAAAEAITVACARVGRHLADTAAYGGFYCIDGILGREGFVATEINPRFAAGLDPAAFAPVPLRLLNKALHEHDEALGGLALCGICDRARQLMRGSAASDIHYSPVRAGTLTADVRLTAELSDSGRRIAVSIRASENTSSANPAPSHLPAVECVGRGMPVGPAVSRLLTRIEGVPVDSPGGCAEHQAPAGPSL
jgi:hypothetical protein